MELTLFPMAHSQRCKAALLGVVLCFAPSLVSAQWPYAVPPFQAGFPVSFEADDAAVWASSTVVAQLDATPELEIIVGTLDGKVIAYHGDGTKYWEYDTGAMGISAKPAVGDVDNDGLPEIVVGAGSTLTPGTAGVLKVLNHDGSEHCTFTPADTISDGLPDGIFAAAALADLDGNDNGKLEIVVAGWDFHLRVLNDDCSEWWSTFLTDTIWSSPAIGDLDGDGALDIVVGSDTNDVPTNHYGGRIHAFTRTGSILPGFPVDIEDVVYSSPALGDLDGDGYLDIVVGMGDCWDVPGCAPGPTHPVDEKVFAVNRFGNALPGWPVATPDEYAFASPALADLDNDGDLEVIINTIAKNSGSEGKLMVLDGDGSPHPGWPKQPVIPLSCDTERTVDTGASPIAADLDSDGMLEVLLVSNWEIVIWDQAGNQLTRDGGCPDPPGDWVTQTNSSLGSSPSVADLDGDGDVEVVIGGAILGGSRGALYAWDFAGVDPTGPRSDWPSARHDAVNSGLQLPGLVFVDGFESGTVNYWSSATP